MDRVQEQWDRTKRYFARFEAIDGRMEHTVSSDHYIDDIYAFFQNCYHLKDWIKNDGTAPIAKRNGVEGYINSHPCLQLCADLCNGLKHLKLNNPRSGSEPIRKGRAFSLAVGGG